MKTPLLSLLVAGCLAVVPGCGGPHAAKVYGLVTLDGEPLTRGGGTVTFHPVEQGALAYGQIDAQGRYQLSTGSDAGLTPGKYAATVVANEPLPLQNPNDEPQFRPLTPDKYRGTATSDLKVEVKPGDNDIPLALVSK
ncbi:MAG: hypothetical protein SFU86_10035 [Pirellulaceae bacterium]|nr:hypothetical protein [Pirellulaceae bacterium]